MRKIKLGEVLDVKRGASISGEYYATEGDLIRLTLGNFNYPGGGFKPNTSKDNIYYVGPVRDEFIMKKGDIITPLTEQVRGLLGETAIIPESGKYIQNGDVGKIIPYEDVLDKSFAAYLISSPVVKAQLDAAAQQTKIRHTSPDKIKDCTAWIPELPVQKKIGKLMDDINVKIKINNQINSELESLAITIYDYWFLQFEFPNEEGKPYKSSGGKMVWNDELKREIPEGWEVKNLGSITKCLLGGTPSRKIPEYWNGSINWINSGEVNNFRISTASEKITESGLKNTSTYLMPKNTVVLAITGATLGQVSILNIEACANQSVIGIIENENLPTEYIYPWIITSMKELMNNQTGAAQPHVNKNDIESLNILLPNADLMKEYLKKVKPGYDAILNNSTQNQELASLRDFLLPMLMNGQVTFKEN